MRQSTFWDLKWNRFAKVIEALPLKAGSVHWPIRIEYIKARCTWKIRWWITAKLMIISGLKKRALRRIYWSLWFLFSASSISYSSCTCGLEALKGSWEQGFTNRICQNWHTMWHILGIRNPRPQVPVGLCWSSNISLTDVSTSRRQVSIAAALQQLPILPSIIAFSECFAIDTRKGCNFLIRS